jgi:hypothetical protein
MAKQYVVTGAYVTVKTNTADGPKLVGLYDGAPWPADAPEEATEHHLREGLIAEVGKAPEVNPAAGFSPTEPVDPERVTLPEPGQEDAGKPPEGQSATATQERAERLQTTGTLSPPPKTRGGGRGKSEGERG